jgi:hypothetical protein
MGVITDGKSGRTRMLPECAVVGRAPICDIRLDGPRVSAEHAALRWADGVWLAVDLRSRNGTWIDGARLSRGDSGELSLATPISFGSPGETWALTEDGPPRPFVRGGGRDLEIVDGLLALPSADDPQLTIGRTSYGAWFVEDDDGRRPAQDRSVHAVAGHHWRLYLPSELSETDVGLRSSSSVDEALLVIRQGPTEGQVTAELRLECEHSIDLGSRAHHLLLLELARARFHDRQRGVDPAEEGWIHRDELSNRLEIDVSHVNILIHRLRRQLVNRGVTDGPDVIQRRARSGLIRLAPAQIRVDRL